MHQLRTSALPVQLSTVAVAWIRLASGCQYSLRCAIHDVAVTA